MVMEFDYWDIERARKEAHIEALEWAYDVAGYSDPTNSQGSIEVALAKLRADSLLDFKDLIMKFNKTPRENPLLEEYRGSARKVKT